MARLEEGVYLPQPLPCREMSRKHRQRKAAKRKQTKKNRQKATCRTRCGRQDEERRSETRQVEAQSRLDIALWAVQTVKLDSTCSCCCCRIFIADKKVLLDPLKWAQSGSTCLDLARLDVAQRSALKCSQIEFRYLATFTEGPPAPCPSLCPSHIRQQQRPLTLCDFKLVKRQSCKPFASRS